jgi:hypothetical protein
MTVARFDPSGIFIFIGTASGKVLVFNSRTKTVRLTSSSVNLLFNLMYLDDRTS